MMATGTAQAQTIESALELVDCGQVEFRKPITVNFKLKNNTGKPFSITEATTDCGCTTIEIPRATIAAGEEYKVTAVYDAKTLGRFVKRAYLTLNNGLEPLRLTIRGIVVDEVVSYAGGYHYTLGALMVDQNDIEFEDVNRSETIQDHTHPEYQRPAVTTSDNASASIPLGRGVAYDHRPWTLGRGYHYTRFPQAA